MYRLRTIKIAVACGLAVAPLYADFTYEQTTQITGGMLVNVMKMASVFSKESRKAMDPIQATVSIKGNRMAHKTTDSNTIVNLDDQTITTVHYADKTYSAVTFEQMKQAMEQMAEKMKSHGGAQDMQFDVKVDDTGKTQSINGNNAHELVMTIKMQGTDAKSGAKGGLDMINDMWIAPDVPGYQEVRDFHKRMAEKLNWIPGSSPMMNRPDMMKAMSELYKEGAKLDGMPIRSNVKVGGNMEGMPAGSAQSTQSQGSQQAGAPPPTSMSGALAGALGGRFGLGGRRKKGDDAAASDSSGAAPSGANSAGSNSPYLIEMTSEVTNYHAGSADSALFQVPEGFRKVEEDPANPRRRK